MSFLFQGKGDVLSVSRLASGPSFFTIKGMSTSWAKPLFRVSLAFVLSLFSLLQEI